MTIQASLAERLAVALVRNAHVAIWVADKNHKIVLWNSGAEQLYGYSAQDALGKNYLDLFVDEVERDQSIADCKRVIDTGYRQQNCLAYDHDTSGRRTHMLTNCFRVEDPITNMLFQAEIGVEITDLQLRDKEHRELREVGRERVAFQKRALELRQKALTAGIERIQTDVLHLFGIRKRDLDRWLLDKELPDREVIQPTYDRRLEELKDEKRENSRLLSEFKDQVQICESEEHLNDLLLEWAELEARVVLGKNDL